MAIDPQNLTATATLTFSAEFNTFQIWDGMTGWDTTGGPQWGGRVHARGTYPYNNELEWYVDPTHQLSSGEPVLPNPFRIADGVLDITAAPADPSIQSFLDGQRYTSGMINTYHEFSQTYGYFEMRAELPAGRGLLPAFWLLPVGGSSLPELDIMEMLGNNPTTLYTTAHSQVSGAIRVSPTQYQTSHATTVSDMSTGFHTYGVDWEPDYITWYFDGQKVFQTATPSDMNKPMYMLVNLAVGGDWPGSPDATTSFPATMQIDYVHVYDVYA